MHTGITADAEIRRLQRLAEKPYDWCVDCSAAAPAHRDSIVASGRRVLRAVRSLVGSRKSPEGSIAFPLHSSDPSNV